MVVNVVRNAAQREPDEHPIVFRNDSNSRRLAASSR
jgi:pyrroloquinoline quinone biosynthesis protein E